MGSSCCLVTAWSGRERHDLLLASHNLDHVVVRSEEPSVVRTNSEQAVSSREVDRLDLARTKRERLLGIHIDDTPQGRLAEIILLDQFCRNIHRDTPQAFASDPLALALAQEAVAHGADTELKAKQVPFLFMPYMHSESKKIHEIAMILFSREAAAGNLEFERRHKVIIDQFGRYPHRNEILGRESTPEEVEFLSQPGSSF